MLYELFLIMVFGFIIYHFYINVTNYLNIGTPFVEGMTSSTTSFNFFPSSNINKRGKPMDSDSGALSRIKTIPGDAGSNIKLEYEFKIRDQGWGNNTYGEVYLINKTTNKTKLIKKGKGRGTQIHKGSMDISDHVKAGDKVQIKFKTSRWTSGHKLFWFYLKNLNLKYAQKRRINRMNRGPPPKRFLVRYYRIANRQTAWWWKKMKLRRNQNAPIGLFMRTRRMVYRGTNIKPLNRYEFLFMKKFDRNNSNSLSWYEFRDWMAGVQFSRNRRRIMRQRIMRQRIMRQRNMRQRNMRRQNIE